MNRATFKTELLRVQEFLKTGLAQPNLRDGLLDLAEIYCPSHLLKTGELTPEGQRLMSRKTIPLKDFIRKIVVDDPDFLAQLTEPLEILPDGESILNLRISGTTSLSPFLYCAVPADFSRCNYIKKAEGHFLGKVDFTKSEIEEIGELSVASTKKTLVANFFCCRKLKNASGHYEGHVVFDESGIEKIENLEITKTDEKNWAASFASCPNLKTAEGSYPGYASFANSGITSIGELQITRRTAETLLGAHINIRGCKNLKDAPLTFLTPKIAMDQSLQNHLRRKLTQQKAAKARLKQTPPLEL